MVFDEPMLLPFLKNKIPTTLFAERPKSIPGPLIEPLNDLFRVVYQRSQGKGLDYGVFHSKLMLLEFDDKLRVVVSSANLYEHDWEHMSNVIWFQDFPKKSVLADSTESSPEFQEYL